MIRKGAVRAAVIGVAVALISGIGFAWYAGGTLIEPALRSLAAPPPELSASAIVFPSESGSMIHAWYSRGVPGKGAVLLFHGFASNRSAMLGRAVFLH